MAKNNKIQTALEMIENYIGAWPMSGDTTVRRLA